VDQAFRTAGRRGNFASRRYFVTLGCEQSKGSPNECLFLSGTIPRPLRTGSVPAPSQAKLKPPLRLPLARCYSVHTSCASNQRTPSDGTIASKIECDKFVYIL
jgi:hypothetical protein